jgi:hypothetical protein
MHPAPRTGAERRTFSGLASATAGPPKAARQLADQLRVPVYGYSNPGGSLFTDDAALGKGERAVTSADIAKKLPNKVKDVWLVPINGTPTFKSFTH